LSFPQVWVNGTLFGQGFLEWPSLTFAPDPGKLIKIMELGRRLANGTAEMFLEQAHHGLVHARSSRACALPDRAFELGRNISERNRFHE
jgi:hypothetical protein